MEKYVQRPNRSTACTRFGRYRSNCLEMFPIKPQVLNILKPVSAGCVNPHWSGQVRQSAA
jgi:hypothetical protein